MMAFIDSTSSVGLKVNFSAHIAKLIEATRIAVDKDKRGIVLDFRSILSTAGSLLRTSDFEFWQRQLGQTELSQLPITKHGLSEVRRHLQAVTVVSRGDLKPLLLTTCEDLFTYSHADDICPAQFDYHYYYHSRSATVFKESGFGSRVPDLEIEDWSDVRIAFVSELSMDDSELVTGGWCC